MKAIRLRTEYLKNPIGIDIAQPQLFWNCQGDCAQTAYRIIAKADGETVWDSGKVDSPSMRAQWNGTELGSRRHITWQVQLWNENGEAGELSEEAHFELGLLKPSDWKAHWICGKYKVNKRKRYPVDCFRKLFSVEDFQKARLYITACGLYEAKLNGVRVGNFVMAPGLTDYRKRVQYQTYDVTELIQGGENAVEVMLADGWYRGSCGAWGLRNQYGKETKLLAQLEITDSNGNVHIIYTDESWDWSNDGPIRFADNKDGEVYDASAIPSYNKKAKKTSHSVVPTASNNVPVTEHERFTPSLIITPSGKQVLDFGQNIAGYVEFRINAKKGQQVFLRFGEVLDKDGEFTQTNIQCSTKHKTTPLQQVAYTCCDGENYYKTTFAVFGFQYVLIETDVPFKPEDFTSIAVYSDMEQTGFFESSNELLNRFVDATVWSTKGNSLDIPTDCPTRERHGWSGDAQIFFETAAYLFDYAAFSKKYLRDMYDWQKKNGRLPQIAPYGGVDFYMYVMNGSVGWADAGVLIPYRFSRLYGDNAILEQHYEGMKKYADFMTGRCGKWGGPYAKPLRIKGKAKKYAVNRGQSYGEWAEPADVHKMIWTDMAEPHPEVSTAYTSHVMSVMEDVAQKLGRHEDMPLYHEYAQGCKNAYQALRRTKKYSLDTDRQADLVRPLYMNLLDDEQTEFARKRLVKALDNYGWRLGTGFLSTPLILYVLADIDIELAYRLLENEQIPGWLSMPRQGATTIWEGWEGPNAPDGIASLNHYSKGAVCEWLFKAMCGICISKENHFDISPRPGGHFTYAKAAYQSIYGKVKSSWVRENNKTVYTVTVPENCTAKIALPGGRMETVLAGTHIFEE